MVSSILPATNLLLIVIISAIVIHNFSYLAKHRNDKNKLLCEISYLYPLVKPEFYKKPISQQIVENNQEIHELEQRVLTLENTVKKLSEELARG